MPLTIVQHNVRAWNSYKIPLCNIYNSIKPDVILMNETNIIDSPIKIFNYKVFQLNSTGQPQAGVAIAVHQSNTVKLHDDFFSDLLAITINTHHGPLTIATSYIPPRIGFLHYPDYYKLFRRDNPTLYIGDANAHHTQFGHNSSNRVGRQIKYFIDQGLTIYQGPDFPTYMTHNSATTPDIALSSPNFPFNLHLRAGPSTPSDHIPVIATVSIQPVQIPIRPRSQPHRADWDKFKNLISNRTFYPPPEATLEEIDEQLNSWTEAVKQAASESIPTIYKRAIPGVKPDHIIYRLQIAHETLLTELRTYGPTPARYQTLLRIRHDIKQHYTTLHSQAWDRLIRNLQLEEDPKSFWRQVSRLLGSNKQTAPYILGHNREKLHTAEEKEQHFRVHWQGIFSDNGENDNDFTYTIEYNMLHRHAHLTTPHHTADFSRFNDAFPPISVTEFKSVLKTFKDKAPGPSGITTQQLRHLPHNMTLSIVNIYNNALSAGYFPDQLKVAHMVLIPKGGAPSQHNVKNYRPISLLDIHAKILDKILNTRLNTHLHNNATLNIRQHGFRASRGTHTAIATINETISQKIREKCRIDIVLRDVAKAFDKVWHVGLKHKLLSLGLHDCFFRTLCDYLDDRKAAIRLGSYVGELFDLCTGVPQGANLSPTLYSFFIHDMPEPIPNTDYVCFADDITQITYSHNTPSYHARLTQRAIEQINEFEARWKITTNTNKFQIIPISRVKTGEILVDGLLRPYTSQGKVLGLLFNPRGFSPQIQNRINIARSKLLKLYRFGKLLPHTKQHLYTAIVRSALLYPTIPLHTLSKTQTLKLQRVQNQALRYITNTSLIDHIHSQALHEQQNIAPINITLHRQAKALWEKIVLNNPEIDDQFPLMDDHFHNSHSRFPSSRKIASLPEPAPLYT